MLFPFEMFILCTSFFLIWQCPDIQVIAIHAFHKIYPNIEMPDLEVKTKIFWWVF